MRTTLDLEDQLLSEAKAYAARSRTSLTSVIEESLRQYLPAASAPRKLGLSDLPVTPLLPGSGGLMPGVEPSWSLGKFEAFLDENP